MYYINLDCGSLRICVRVHT